ncbi:hypothetical protein ACFFX0_02010 [Citricoccus parietis]|uniref:Uncharacterized protein n=1 Tax=Citricoccus parietis TaxID=592307 RepID=A0ABV5FTM9_9MICC
MALLHRKPSPVGCPRINGATLSPQCRCGCAGRAGSSLPAAVGHHGRRRPLAGRGPAHRKAPA